MKRKKKVVIVGGGIAGLSAGCYALMNGYEVELHEAQPHVGGLCTGWQRGAYLFDGCIHWLTGSGPANGFHKVWRELGAVQGKRMFYWDTFARVRDKDGKVFNVYVDAERLRAHMKELSPSDAPAIDRLCDAFAAVSGLDMRPGKAEELWGFLDKLKVRLGFLRYAKPFMFLASNKMQNYADGFKDPFLRKVFAMSFYGLRDCPLLPLAFTLGPMNKRAAGFPEGGSVAFVQGIVKRFLDLGGRLVPSSRVERVIEEGGCAKGIVANGKEIRSDFVISSMDLRTTLEKLLGGRPGDETHRLLLESRSSKLMEPAVQVSIGAAIDLSADNDTLGELVELPEPVSLGGREESWIPIRHFSFDPSFAPTGKSALTCFFSTDWGFWEATRNDPAAYEAEKAKYLDACLVALERRYPGFRAKVERTDVVTPLTFERYTGNWQGVYMTWNLNREFREKYGYIRKTVPGLSNFWMASMWTHAPGGLPGAAKAGRDVIQLMCAQDNKRFRTTEP